MGATVFIGDELTATGYRLAGADVMTPSPAETATAFARACADARLVIVTAEFARRIPSADLDTAIVAETPIVTVVPDILGRTAPPDPVRRLRSTLGIET
jgi:vacuolar-type H+-ATPase subunit F/Vma7